MSEHAEIQTRRLVRPETPVVSISGGGTYVWDPRRYGVLNINTAGSNYNPLVIDFHPDYVPVNGETLRIEGRQGGVGGFVNRGMIDLQTIVGSEVGPRPSEYLQRGLSGTLVFGRVNSIPVVDSWVFYPDVVTPTAEDVVRSLHTWGIIPDGIGASAQVFEGPTFPLPNNRDVVKCSIDGPGNSLDLTYITPLWNNNITSGSWAYGSPGPVNNWMVSDDRTYYGCQPAGATGTQLGGYTGASSSGAQFGAHVSSEGVWVVDVNTADANEVSILLIGAGGGPSIYRSTNAGSTWTGLGGLSTGGETVLAVVPDVRLDSARSGTFFMLTEEGSIWYCTGAGGIGVPSLTRVAGPTGSAFLCGTYDSFASDAYFGGADGQVYRAIGDDWANPANYESTGNISSIYTVRSMTGSGRTLWALLGRDRGATIGEEVYIARSDTRAIYWTIAGLNTSYPNPQLYRPYLNGFSGHLYLNIPFAGNNQRPIQFYRMRAI